MSKQSRWSDLDEPRLLAYKKEGKSWEWIFGQFPSRLSFGICWDECLIGPYPSIGQSHGGSMYSRGKWRLQREGLRGESDAWAKHHISVNGVYMFQNRVLLKFPPNSMKS